MTRSICALQKGFMLVEILVYLALFSIIVGGGIVAAFQIVRGAQTAQNHALLVQEAGFMMAKISWMLRNVPGTDISLDGQGNLVLDVPGRAVAPLNTSAIAVADLEIKEESSEGGLSVTTISFLLETGQGGYRARQAFFFTVNLGY